MTDQLFPLKCGCTVRVRLATLSRPQTRWERLRRAPAPCSEVIDRVQTDNPCQLHGAAGGLRNALRFISRDGRLLEPWALDPNAWDRIGLALEAAGDLHVDLAALLAAGMGDWSTELRARLDDFEKRIKLLEEGHLLLTAGLKALAGTETAPPPTGTQTSPTTAATTAPATPPASGP